MLTIQLGLMYANFLVPTPFPSCSAHPSSSYLLPQPLKRMVEIFKKGSVSQVLCREECDTGIPQPGICLDSFYTLSKAICLLSLYVVIPNLIFCLLFYSLLLSLKNCFTDTQGCIPTVPSNWPLPFVFTVLGFLVSVSCYTKIHFYSGIIGSSPYTE